MQSLLHSTDSQRGFIQFITVILIALGIGLGVFLVQKQTQLLPQAATPSPTCVPRPACLDAIPACQIPEDPNMCPPPKPPLKIMPLGDSLTWGINHNALSGTDPNVGGYRVYFWEKSLQEGLSINFVGSQLSGPSKLPDKEHEGHNGWGIGLYTPRGIPLDAVYENIDAWMDAEDPDVILMMLGTNDLAQPFLAVDIPSAPQRLGMLIDKIFAKKPSVYLFAATIPPANLAYIPNIIEYIRVFNSAAVSVINSKKGPGRKLELVDMYANLTLADIDDQVHPNEAGYQKIADLFYNAVINNLPPGYSLNKPSISITQNQISKGSSVTVSWNNVVYPFGNDFIGLYTPGSVDLHGYLDFQYTSTCSKQAGTPRSFGSCDFPVDQTGQYEFRLFSQGSYLKLGTSSIVNVIDTVPPLSPSPTGTIPPASVTPVPAGSPSPSPSSSDGGLYLKPGDIDGNGKVNIFDFSLFLSEFGKKGQNLKADFNNNGGVDIFDFSILLSNWGK